MAGGGLKKRSVNLAGHATSLALEPEFWAVLDTAAAARCLSLSGLIAGLDAGRGARPLASACRVFALEQAAVSGAGASGPASAWAGDRASASGPAGRRES